ncbi:glycoside hydrolase family 26 protein [Sphaerimonospora mesophila]|uniref:glycoside hydrolase family 26 protein n=1 Tax=Sphaerimonospora mesophila TaxID=37483 RepID=UPI0006E1ED15
MRGTGLAGLLAGGCLVVCAACAVASGTSNGAPAPGAWPKSTRAGASPGAGMPAGRATPEACAVTDKLIPTCGAWWGIASDVSPGRGSLRATEVAERRMGRRADIVHVYHRGAELFPTPQEREVARGPRLLLINWRPAPERTWAQIARGAVDDRIDRLADHIVRTFPGRFFLTIHHEPESEVRRGAGYSATDYVAMYRHVVTRLRGRGVRNAVTVMTYGGALDWVSKPWFDRLYPGDDVVDWVAFDPYADNRVSDFAGLVNRTRRDNPGWPGFYQWLQQRFPAKPIMLAEWGVFERPRVPRYKRDFFASVKRQIGDYPQIKAMVYFDSPLAPRGDTRFDTTPGAGKAFSRLARIPRFTATPVPPA